MKLLSHFVGALIAATLTSSLTAGAAPQIERTPPPNPPKPDWSTMSFLMGTWNCTDWSSRRPGPFTITRVYTMDNTGYWVIRNDTTHMASWIPRDFHSTTRYTYDAGMKKWVRISMGDQGDFAVQTAPNPVNGSKTWTYVFQSTNPSIASYAPEVYHRSGNRKLTMTTTFKEPNGRVVNVHETCLKT